MRINEKFNNNFVKSLLDYTVLSYFAQEWFLRVNLRGQAKTQAVLKTWALREEIEL